MDPLIITGSIHVDEGKWYVDDPLPVTITVKTPSESAVNQAKVTAALLGSGTVEDTETVLTDTDGTALLSLVAFEADHYEIVARAQKGEQKGSAHITSERCYEELPFDVGSVSATAPSVSNVALSNDGDGNLAFSFDTDEQLGTSASAIGVTVDGPSTKDVYSFGRTDFTEYGSSPWTYSLSTIQGYTDGTGTYTATVDAAVDPNGNDGANGEGDSYFLSTPRTGGSTSTSGELDTDFSDNTHSITTALF